VLLADGIRCAEPRLPLGGYWLSAEFHARPEVRAASLYELGAFLGCGIWCASYGPHVPTYLFRMVGCTKRAAAGLVRAGLWEPASDGYLTKTMADLRTRRGRFGCVMLVTRLLAESPAGIAAGVPALGLWSVAASWSLAAGEPGWIPPQIALEYGTRKHIEALCSSGLWERFDGGYWMTTGDHPIEARWAIGRDDERAPIPPEVRQHVYARDSYRCVACGSPDRLSLDHIIPWSAGGPDTEDNLQTLCRPCNSSKGALVA